MLQSTSLQTINSFWETFLPPPGARIQASPTASGPVVPAIPSGAKSVSLLDTTECWSVSKLSGVCTADAKPAADQSASAVASNTTAAEPAATAAGSGEATTVGPCANGTHGHWLQFQQPLPLLFIQPESRRGPREAACASMSAATAAYR